MTTVWLGSLVLPNTDWGVLIEVLAVGVVSAAGLMLSWRHREWRVVVLGVTVCAFALLALRALH